MNIPSRPDAPSADVRRPERALITIAKAETGVLLLMLAQIIFAGLLRLLPPDVRAALAFLHRIEWGIYVTIALIAATIGYGWPTGVLVTNRLYLLGWFAWLPRAQRIIRGRPARTVLLCYGLVACALVGALLYVRANGFIVQPVR
jgi:hypothetical protein